METGKGLGWRLALFSLLSMHVCIYVLFIYVCIYLCLSCVAFRQDWNTPFHDRQYHASLINATCLALAGCHIWGSHPHA